MATNTFSMKDATLIIGGAVASGFSDGDAITITKRENQMNLVVGADGDGCANFSNDHSIEVTVNLLQTSDTAQIISALASAQNLAGGAGVPFLFTAGTTLVECSSLFVQKDADVTVGKEHSPRSFTLIGIADVYNVGDK
jgi:hypothetical protein